MVFSNDCQVHTFALLAQDPPTNSCQHSKALAKSGDRAAAFQEKSLKLLINGSYGFMGTGYYTFNDYGAAAILIAVDMHLRQKAMWLSRGRLLSPAPLS